MIKRLLDKYWYSVPNVVKVEYLRICAITLASGLLSPLIIKTQGIEFSLMILGILSFIMRFTSLVVVWLKNVHIKIRSNLYILSTTLGIMISFIYFIDVQLWILFQVIFAFINRILLEMYYTEYDIIIAKNYSSEIFKETQYTEKIIITFSGAFGAGLSIALSFNPSLIIIMVILVAGLLELPLGIKQYGNL